MERARKDETKLDDIRMFGRIIVVVTMARIPL